jgi:hypothetical protein
MKKQHLSSAHNHLRPNFASRPLLLIFVAGLVFFLIFLAADRGRRSGDGKIYIGTNSPGEDFRN